MSTMHYRPLSNIAHDIRRDWKDVYFGAKPYLSAMFDLDSLNDQYMFEDGKSVVRYFLANSSRWRGPVAKLIKDELRRMLANKPIE